MAGRAGDARDDAHLLAKSYDEFVKMEKKFKKLQDNFNKSKEEKAYAQINKDEAERKLIEVVNRIQNETVLVLNNEDQAKVFTTIKYSYFGQRNRGLLERVEIGNVRDDTKRIIWNKLVKVGMELENPTLIFKFP